MAQLPQTPAPNWRQYALRIGIWAAFVGSLAYAAANGGLDFLENDVSLKLEPNRDVVALTGKEPAVIQVKVTLSNNTAKTVALNAQSACKVFRWQIFNTGGGQVQARFDPIGCPEVAVMAQLAPGAKLEEFYSIALEAERYTPGQDYLVNARYWGHEGEFVFKAQ
ncbi:MAG: hypothetical protein K8S25_04140 [Alphaproteobacteria bacterium]|nr:hypothetical protein [Alphaproteobacteria bacterium]